MKTVGVSQLSAGWSGGNSNVFTTGWEPVYPATCSSSTEAGYDAFGQAPTQ